MSGWIKLHRQVIDHWIWDDSQKFKWWIDMLLLTNHKDKKIVMGGELIVIKRGSFHTSELKLSERWNVSRNTVRKFLQLLEKDGMISTKKAKNGTTVEVHNYGVYQGKEEIKKQQSEQYTEQISEHKDEQKTEQQAEQCTEQQCEQKKDNSLNRRVNTNKNIKNYKNYKNVKKEKKQKNNNAFDFFQNNGFGFITQYTSEDINYYLDEFKQDADQIVIAALKIAKDRNKVNWGYAKSILNTWLQSNLQSCEQVRAHEIQQRQKNKSVYQPQSIHSREMTPKWLENREQTKTSETDNALEDDIKAFKEQLAKDWG